jgi:dTDP-glucose 4,6-dehydratase
MANNDSIRGDLRGAENGSAGRLDALRDGVLLVTGGTGFMGRWLAECVALLNDEHGYGIRLRLLARRARTFRETTPHLAERPDVALIDQDVRGIYELDQDVNWIVHAAASPDSRQHAMDPVGLLHTIGLGTHRVLESATTLPALRKALVVSSGHVNGPQPLDVACLPESRHGTVDCASVRSAYAEAKRYAEALAAAQVVQKRTPVTVARPFAFVGPYQSLARPWAMNNFFRDALAGGPIRIWGEGADVRSYMHAADMAWWLLAILVLGGPGGVYNVGSPEGVSLRELAALIGGLFPGGREVLMHTAPHQAAHQSAFVPDVTRAAEELGLAVTLPLKEALRRTLRWHQDA